MIVERVDPATRRRETIDRQLTAMGAERFVLGVHNRAEDRMYRLANMSADQVLAHEREFAALNVRGRDIYIAPIRNAGLVLIDDLPVDTLARLKADGLDPALAVETSPANYQAWIRVAPEELPKALATAVSRELALRYSGDRGSVGAEHLGRLAGYTNQKPSRILPDGRHPWVRLHEAEGRQAPMAEHLLDAVRARLEAARDAQPHLLTHASGGVAWAQLSTQPARDGAPAVSLTPEYLAQEFALRAGRVLERQRERDGRTDPSAVDWAAIGSMHERYPGLSTAQLAQAMRMGSPNLEERHRGHVADYVGRTVVKAVRAQREPPTHEAAENPEISRPTRQETRVR